MVTYPTGPDTAATWWHVADCADYCGITASTWRKYVSQGHAPAPDDPDDDRPPNRRSPRWHPATVTSWHTGRLGPGRWGPRTVRD